MSAGSIEILYESMTLTNCNCKVFTVNTIKGSRYLYKVGIADKVNRTLLMKLKLDCVKGIVEGLTIAV
jgi:hypothetical protein